jgi:hypothetical protein
VKSIRSTVLFLALAAAAIGVGSSPAARPRPRPRPHPPAWQLAGPGGFAFGFGSAWIAGRDAVLRVNPRTNRVLARIASGGRWPIATADGIWIEENGALDRIDPARNRVVVRIPLPSSGSVAYGFGSFWVTTGDGSLLRVDPAAKQVVATIPVQGPVDWELQVAAGADGVYVASADKHEVVKVDASTNAIAWTAPVGGDDSLLTVGAWGAGVWAHENAGGGGRGLLFRLDPATGKVLSTLTTSTAPGGDYGGTDIAFGGNYIWTANGNGTVSRISGDGSRVLRAVKTPFATEFLAVALGSVWIQSDGGLSARIPLARFAS